MLLNFECYSSVYHFHWLIRFMRFACIPPDNSLVPFPVLENKTAPYTIEHLSKRLLTIGAVPAGGFLVDCETFQCVQDTINSHMGK